MKKKRHVAKQADSANTEVQPPMFIELSQPGYKRFGGYIQDEWHKDLQGTNAVKVYREMGDNEPIIGAFNLALGLLTRHVTFRVEPKDETPQAKVAADLIETALYDFEGGIKGLVDEARSFVQYGWSWFEKVFKVRGGDSPIGIYQSKYNDRRIGWRKISPRTQEGLERWELGPHSEVLGIHHRAYPDMTVKCIPRSKSLHFRLIGNRGNPEGRSLYRNAYTPYYFAKLIKVSEAIGIDRNMAGFPYMQVPPGMITSRSDSDRAAYATYQEMVQKIRVDKHAGLVLPAEVGTDGKPTGFKFSLLSTGGKNVTETDPIIRRYESRIAIALLCEFMLLGMDKHGSFALASDKTDLFALGVGAILDAILDVMNDEAIPELCALNGIPRELAPELKRGDIEKVNLAELAQFISSTAGVGALKIDDGLDKHLRDQAGIPEAETVPMVSVPEQIDTAQPEAIATTAQPAADGDQVNIQEGEQAQADVALNGAQVASLVEILGSVARRELPRDSAVEMIMAAFQLDRDKVERIVGDVGRTFFQQETLNGTEPAPLSKVQ